jgi:hypothetical protein
VSGTVLLPKIPPLPGPLSPQGEREYKSPLPSMGGGILESAVEVIHSGGGRSVSVVLYISHYSEIKVFSQNISAFRYSDYEKEVKWIISIL